MPAIQAQSLWGGGGGGEEMKNGIYETNSSPEVCLYDTPVLFASLDFNLVYYFSPHQKQITKNKSKQ